MQENVSNPVSESAQVSDLQFSIQIEKIANNYLLSPRTNEGARLVFLGLVRDYNKASTGVTSLLYECYMEMALKVGKEILAHTLQKFEIKRIACIHRIGLLGLQDIAIRIEIGSGHRIAAFHACEYLMDTIKEELPVWKKEYIQDKGEWL